MAVNVDKSKIRKPCPEPECHGTLIVRVNSHTGEEFMGCDRYPNCRHTEPIPEYLRMIAAGVPTLFEL